MSYFVVDVETDGPIPHKFSMISFGAVKLDQKLETTFLGKVKPISTIWNAEALAVSNITRAEHLTYDNPNVVMQKFKDWLDIHNEGGRPVFISDNNGFDFAWINWYFHTYLNENPFGFSSRRIGDVFSGLTRNMANNTSWKKFRKTKHTHNPVDDAKGNAEAILHFVNQFNLKGIF